MENAQLAMMMSRSIELSCGVVVGSLMDCLGLSGDSFAHRMKNSTTKPYFHHMLQMCIYMRRTLGGANDYGCSFNEKLQR